ncbi:MAG: tRNA threonylcarbamoyladenosine dehydratase [Muribaculaceae bacterium]|nr:tRNA threonylcarbamoyladenosine dehydratase [Muribaculaceae bacterium]
MENSNLNSRFGRMRLLAGDTMMQRMSALRVALFGLGGVGSWCAEALVRAGVGHITIVDSDTVALSNCNRQLPALDSTVGLPKAEVLRARLLDINPDCEVEARAEAFTPENAATFDLGSYDYVVDAIDSLSCKAQLLLDATAAGAHTVSSMGAALKVHSGMIATAEFGRVQGCPLARALRTLLRRSGRWPSAPVQCVYSPERLHNRIESLPPSELNPDELDMWTRRKAAINGTLSHTTAIFGMRLAGLILEHIYDETEMQDKH